MISSVPPPIGPSRASRRPVRARARGRVEPSRLDAGVDRVESGSLRAQLGDRDLADRLLAGEKAAKGCVGHITAGFDRHRDLGQLVASRLPATPVAIPDGSERELEARLHGTDRAQGHQQPLPLEVGHDQVEAAVLLTEQVLLGDEHVVERDLGGVRGMPAQLP